MKPIEFKEMNCTLAKDQPEYLPLPVKVTDDGIVISCWELSFKEKLKILFTGKLWVSIYTFGSRLQPQLPTIDKPSWM